MQVAAPRFAGSRFIRALPFVGDIAAGGLEIMDPTESIQKNIKDALIIGGGGFAASLATGGLDAVPSLANFAVDAAASVTGNKDLKKLGDKLDYVDPTSYLQYVSDAAHYGKGISISTDQRFARLDAMNSEQIRRQQQTQASARPAPTAFETGSDNPKIGIETAPLRGGGQDAVSPLTSANLRVSITPDTIDEIEAAVQNLSIVKGMTARYLAGAAAKAL